MMVEAGGTSFARAMRRSYFERGAWALGLIAIISLLCLVTILINRSLTAVSGSSSARLC
jgi:hypothetical protein